MLNHRHSKKAFKSENRTRANMSCLPRPAGRGLAAHKAVWPQAVPTRASALGRSRSSACRHRQKGGHAYAGMPGLAAQAVEGRGMSRGMPAPLCLACRSTMPLSLPLLRPIGASTTTLAEPSDDEGLACSDLAEPSKCDKDEIIQDMN